MDCFNNTMPPTETAGNKLQPLRTVGVNEIGIDIIFSGIPDSKKCIGLIADKFNVPEGCKRKYRFSVIID